jgi:hypothetical protein
MAFITVMHTSFNQLQDCTHRKVVHDDGKGRQRVEVDHRSEWRFLWHHGSFTTSLLVEQVNPHNPQLVTPA